MCFFGGSIKALISACVCVRLYATSSCEFDVFCYFVRRMTHNVWIGINENMCVDYFFFFNSIELLCIKTNPKMFNT